MINYAVFLVPSYYFEDRYGIKNTVIFGLLLLVIGSLIRCGAFYSFWWIFVGSCISACSLPFVFNPITKISAIWFQEDKVRNN
jgi:MFS family permease